MNSKSHISISIPKSKDGMIGRECFECKKYFKIKPGTGLKTNICHCPYCEFMGDSNLFHTQDQIEFAKSKAVNKISNDFLKEFNNMFKDLEKDSRNSFLKLEVKSTDSNFDIPIKYYYEKSLQTDVICDKCGLNFSIYGVFAKCPDCVRMNAFLMFDKSLESIKKQYALSINLETPREDIEFIWSSILVNCVSIFDSFGKEIRKQNPILFLKQQKNLFQNIIKLNDLLDGLIKKEHSNYDFLIEYFHVRHLYQHNMGVIDEDFLKNIPGYESQIGRKYVLYKDKILFFINAIEELKEIIKNKFDK